MFLQPLGERQRVAGVALAAQRQGLHTQHQLLRRKGVQRAAYIAQDLDPNADGEGDLAECFPELQAMVAVAWLDHLREARGVGAPVEVSAVDDDAADGGAVAADPFGGGVHDDVDAVVEGAAEVAACAKGVVYHDGDAFSMCYFYHRFEIRDIVAWIADAF